MVQFTMSNPHRRGLGLNPSERYSPSIFYVKCQVLWYMDAEEPVCHCVGARVFFGDGALVWTFSFRSRYD